MLLEIFLTFTTFANMPSWASDAQLVTGIDPRLITAICTVETKGRVAAYTPRDGHSPSYGVCQIKESAARLVGFRGQPSALMDSSLNATLAAKYLKHQLNRYHSLKLALSAYNAGRAISANRAYVDAVLLVYKNLGGKS